ncbi:MAG: UDP-3-O-(3-hydroxymyristoyl)glucosamine N-acyltransferase [Xanthomonadales bacterium]|nr:UDP-3-O-(3-hydroxymyristoyl)glucosamine N-acyltransferase [Xanthomonadales bacterium]
MPTLTLGELAQRFALTLQAADPAAVDRPITGVATLEAAGPTQLSFFTNPRYRQALSQTQAAAVVLAVGDAAQSPGTALVSKEPYADFARIAALFETADAVAPGIHPSAVIDPSAEVDASASIGPHVTVGPRSRIGARAQLGPGCVIGADCVVGEDCQLVARVTLVLRVRLGRRVLIHPGAVLGADGFGLAQSGGRWIKVPQLGGVLIGDDCEIGANSCIDRGALGDTVLEEDVRVDNLVQIAHNCEIGAHSALAGCVGIAGSTKLGRHVMVAGASGIAGHLSIPDRTVIQAMSMVTHTIHEPGAYASGSPLMDNRSWKRNMARLRHLDELHKRVAQLEKQLAAATATPSDDGSPDR